MRQISRSFYYDHFIDDHFITKHSETSYNRPYTTSNFISETSFDNDNTEIKQQNLSYKHEDPFQGQEDTPQQEE